MRRVVILMLTAGFLIAAIAAPGTAATRTLDGPDPAIWLSDPEGDDGDNGIEQGDPVVGSSGTARMNAGEGADSLGPPPPPFAFAPYAPGEDNEFHVVIRSHGPKIAGEVGELIHTFGGGCTTEVGPAPGQPGDFPVPVAPGECGDVQLYVFS